MPLAGPVDEALAYKGMLDSGSVRSRSELARMLGVTQARVSQMLRLLELDPEILRYLESDPNPGTLRFFTERRLRGLLAIPERSDRLLRFAEMRQEARAPQ